MKRYQAILFDLDDTLLDRNKAIEKMFSIILEKCYGEADPSTKKEMLGQFKKYDHKSYGINNKIKVLESLFDEYSPKNRLPSQDIMDFWNHRFPGCFSIQQETIELINEIKKHAKVGMITNGTSQRQMQKIVNTHLDNYFETIVISDEVGISKPDKRIFDLALNKLDIQPKNAIFVGDNIEKDIGGCQNANINGIWFNPRKIKNNTEIEPYDEIHSLDQILSYLS